VTVIGSGANAHRRLKSTTVSRAHSLFLNRGGVIVVADLASRRGVLIDGVPRKIAVLNDGSTIQIGEMAFRFSHPGGAAVQEVPRISQAARLVALEGAVEHYVEKPIFVVGRRGACDLVVDAPDVAAAHAVLVEVDGHWMLRSLAPGLQTMVNSKTERKVRLHEDDIVQIGSQQFRYNAVPAESSSQEPLRPQHASHETIERIYSLNADPVNEPHQLPEAEELSQELQPAMDLIDSAIAHTASKCEDSDASEANLSSESGGDVSEPCPTAASDNTHSDRHQTPTYDKEAIARWGPLARALAVAAEQELNGQVPAGPSPATYRTWYAALRRVLRMRSNLNSWNTKGPK
jgi:predicted component of type VI protein secretion system